MGTSLFFLIPTTCFCSPLDQICCQNCKLLSNMKFRNHLGVKSDELFGISKSCICLDVSISIANLCSVMKVEWKLCPMCQFLEYILKIFQMRQLCTKKLIIIHALFLASKVTFYSIYYLYKLFFCSTQCRPKRWTALV